LKKYILLLLLLLLPVAFAQINWTLDANKDYVVKPIISEACNREYAEFFGQDITSVMKNYCSQTNTNMIIVLIIAMLIWLIEPKLKQLLEKEGQGNYAFFIKWVGLGLLAIVLIGLWISRGG